MSNFFHRTGNVVDEIVHAFSQALRYGARCVRRLSWPALLGCALVLAFVISILPLALTLFAIFLVVKLVLCTCSGDRRHAVKEPLQ
jgi:hypothetical protein